MIGMNWSNFIMDFLLLLVGFGNPITPGSDMEQFDFNGNGVIDMQDFIHMLSIQPPITEENTITYHHEETNHKSSMLQGFEVFTY